MKKIIYIVSALLAGFMTSCLDTDSPSAMYDQETFSSSTTAEQAIAGIYEVFGEQNAYRTRLLGGWVGLNTDIEFCTKSPISYADYSMDKVGHSDLTPKDKNPWAYLTSIIERTNLCVRGIEQYGDTAGTSAEAAKMRYLLGEALTLRAFAYYEMTKLWGDVPYSFEPVDLNDPSSIYKAQTDRSVIFAKLRTDLRRAANLMPWSAQCPDGAKNFTGRPSKAFALGLLARIDLVYAGKALRPDGKDNNYNNDPELRQDLINEVAWACSQVINQEGFKFVDNDEGGGFEEVFKKICQGVTAYDQSEVIWEIPFKKGVRGQVLNRIGEKVDVTAMGVYQNTQTSNKANSMVGVTPYLLQLFAKENPSDIFADERLRVTVAPFKWQVKSASYLSKVDFSGTEDKAASLVGLDPSLPERDSLLQYYKVLYPKKQDDKALYLGKYRFAWLSQSYTGEDDGLHLPIMRYADILLMYAEAIAEGVTTDVVCDLTGADALNKVYWRSNIVARKNGVRLECSLDNIKLQRALEFVGENIRKYDLMRWGIFSSQIKLAKMVKGESFDTDGDKETMQFVYYIDQSISQNSNVKALNVWWGPKKYKKDDKSVELPDGKIVDVYKIEEKPFKTKLPGPTYDLYTCSDAELENRQFWPIFDVIKNANYKLENYYGY